MAKERIPVEPAVYPDKPSIIAEIDTEYIIAYCVDKKQVKWLQTVAAKTYVGKDGKERRYGLFQIRKEFITKFMPDLAAKKPKESMFSRIMALEV